MDSGLEETDLSEITTDSDMSVDSESNQSTVAPAAAASISSEEVMGPPAAPAAAASISDEEVEDPLAVALAADAIANDPDAEVLGPADAAAAGLVAAAAAIAAPMVAEMAPAVQATKMLKALSSRPQPVALKNLLLTWINSVDSATILSQRNRFSELSAAVLRLINRQCPRMRHPPLVSVIINPNLRHLWLSLGVNQGWVLQDLESLFAEISREGETTLWGLEIHSVEALGDGNSGLPVVMLGSLLLELRALTSLRLQGNYSRYEVDHLVSILTYTNPGIRDLELPYLSNKSLNTIAYIWPQIELLTPRAHEFDSAMLAAVLSDLRNLYAVAMVDWDLKSEAMMSVARTYDNTTPAYKLSEWFRTPIVSPVSPRRMAKLFTAFPTLYGLTVLETDIPAVCAALQGRDGVIITRLEVEMTSENTRAMEPLLALVGKHLTLLAVYEAKDFFESRVDLGIIGHYCPKLEELRVRARHLVTDDEFGVTETFFANLRECDVMIWSVQPVHLPLPLFRALLASRTLRFVRLGGVPLTEEVVTALAAERGTRGALTSLERLTVWFCSNFSVRALASLVSHSPALTAICLKPDGVRREGLSEIKALLEAFIQQNGLSVTVTALQL